MGTGGAEESLRGALPLGATAPVKRGHLMDLSLSCHPGAGRTISLCGKGREGRQSEPR